MCLAVVEWRARCLARREQLRWNASDVSKSRVSVPTVHFWLIQSSSSIYMWHFLYLRPAEVWLHLHLCHYPGTVAFGAEVINTAAREPGGFNYRQLTFIYYTGSLPKSDAIPRCTTSTSRLPGACLAEKRINCSPPGAHNVQCKDKSFGFFTGGHESLYPTPWNIRHERGLGSQVYEKRKAAT